MCLTFLIVYYLLALLFVTLIALPYFLILLVCFKIESGCWIGGGHEYGDFYLLDQDLVAVIAIVLKCLDAYKLYYCINHFLFMSSLSLQFDCETC